MKHTKLLLHHINMSPCKVYGVKCYSEALEKGMYFTAMWGRGTVLFWILCCNGNSLAVYFREKSVVYILLVCVERSGLCLSRHVSHRGRE